MLIRVTANILKFYNYTQLPSKVENINTEGQGRPINVYFVGKIWKIWSICFTSFDASKV